MPIPSYSTVLSSLPRPTSSRTGRFIAHGGSSFWDVHVDEIEIGGVPTRIVLGSDRRNGLYVFEFD